MYLLVHSPLLHKIIHRSTDDDQQCSRTSPSHNNFFLDSLWSENWASIFPFITTHSIHDLIYNGFKAITCVCYIILLNLRVLRKMWLLEPYIYIDITINLDISYETDHIIYVVLSKLWTIAPQYQGGGHIKAPILMEEYVGILCLIFWSALKHSSTTYFCTVM
jgi:hypothetical protein